MSRGDRGREPGEVRGAGAPEGTGGAAEDLPEPVAQAAGTGRFLEALPHLVLVPVMLVVVAIFITVLFDAGNKSVSDLIDDMKSGGERRRDQAAYALAARIVELEGQGTRQYFSPEETDELLGLLKAYPHEDPFRSWVLIAIGRAGQPGRTLPVLESIVRDPTQSEEVQVAALEALGCTRDGAAVPTLLSHLTKLDAPAQWELRLRALHALAHLRQSGVEFSVAPVEEALARYVHDARKEVSWNVSFWLAEYFGSDAGIHVLRNLVDWEFLDRQRADRPRDPASSEEPRLTAEEKETWMQLAMRGIYALEGEDAMELMRRKSNDKRSLKVRNFALKLLADHAGKKES